MLQRFLTAGLMLAGVTAHAQTEPATMQVIGNFFANRAHVDGIERPFFAQLTQVKDIRTNVTFNSMDQVGIQAADHQQMRRSAARPADLARCLPAGRPDLPGSVEPNGGQRRGVDHSLASRGHSHQRHF